MEKFLQERKKNVDEFIKSYLLHKKLEEVSGFDEDADYTTTVKPIEMNPYDEQLEEGQIRLLVHTDRITYVALLKRWNNNAFVVMPFSRYRFPATDEEFNTSFDGGLYLKVLQAWNTRTLQDETLKQGWLIGFLPQEDFDDAWKMWEATLGDVELGDSLLKKTGLPIYRKIDPRVEYKREELANFARIDEEDLAASTPKINPFTLWTQREAVLAAGEEEKNLQFTFSVAEPMVTVFIEYSPHDKILYLDVYGADGEPSSILDGAMVFNAADATALGTIQGNHLEIPYDSPACSIGIVTKDGRMLDGTNSSEAENG